MRTMMKVALLIAVEVAMICLVFAQPHDSTSVPIGMDSSQMNHQEAMKEPTRFRRSTWHPCYRTDKDGNPIISHTSAGTVIYECEGWTTQACGDVIPYYGYAKCAPIIDSTGIVGEVVGCDCAPKPEQHA